MSFEADILASTYLDRCTITRKSGTFKDDFTKQSRQLTVTAEEDIPCSLSTAKGGSIGFSGGHGSYQSGYTLFCRPETDIQAGDQIAVITQSGRAYTLWAGRPFTYAGSHTETPLSEERPT